MSEINNVLQYKAYFRNLASTHKDIRHNPDSEDGDTELSDMRFASWNLDQLITGNRSKVSYPAMLLEQFEIVTNSENKYDIRINPRGGVTILQHIAEGAKVSEYEAASAYTFEILLSILQKMWQDHYGPDAVPCSTPFASIDLNGVEIIEVPRTGDNEIGWRAEFGFRFHNSIKISKAPAPGTFL